jgi:hypothetical protein
VKDFSIGPACGVGKGVKCFLVGETKTSIFQLNFCLSYNCFTNLLAQTAPGCSPCVNSGQRYYIFFAKYVPDVILNYANRFKKVWIN